MYNFMDLFFAEKSSFLMEIKKFLLGLSDFEIFAPKKWGVLF